LIGGILLLKANDVARQLLTDFVEILKKDPDVVTDKYND
jgi:hypothetical protein